MPACDEPACVQGNNIKKEERLDGIHKQLTARASASSGSLDKVGIAIAAGTALTSNKFKHNGASGWHIAELWTKLHIEMLCASFCSQSGLCRLYEGRQAQSPSQL